MTATTSNIIDLRCYRAVRSLGLVEPASLSRQADGVIFCRGDRVWWWCALTMTKRFGRIERLSGADKRATITAEDGARASLPLARLRLAPGTPDNGGAA